MEAINKQILFTDKLLVPGNPIQSFQDKANAEKLMKALSFSGIKLEMVEEQTKQNVPTQQTIKGPAGGRWIDSLELPDDWYEKSFYILVLCFIFAPAGLILLWRAKLYSQQTRVILSGIFGIWFMIALGLSSMIEAQTPSEKPTVNKVSKKMWFQGGNLHDASVAQWKEATYQNKLATASDWLASGLWKGHLNTPSDFDNIKVKAQMLVEAVDGVVVDNNQIDHWKVNESAAAIIILSNDLGP